MKALLDRVRAYLDRHSRLVRFAVVFVALLLAAIPLARLIPRGTDVAYDLGEDHAFVRELSLAYLPVGGESTRAIRIRFPDGAPETYRHHVELAPGRYEVHARVVGADSERFVTRYLDIPRGRDAEDIELYDRPLFGR